MSWLKIAVCALVFLLALGITLYPFVSNYLAEKYQSTAIAAYSDAISRMDDTTLMREREAAQQFNSTIGVTSMSGPDAISRLNAARDGYDDLLDVNNNGIMGYIRIPAIDVELPIYLGATYDNMAAGAVHLSQTSLPIGSMNTNCVIAAHRGWYGAPYFRYIDVLKIGDEVTITNLWETLTYKVSEVKIIDPDDVDEILIQPGRELLTLVTCHPYASGGLYRYIVYCERVP